RKPGDGGTRDEGADAGQEGGLGERGEVLRLPVAVGMPAVCGSDRYRDGEEREQRGREVGPRMSGLGEEAEAAARKTGGELDDDQEAGGPDRDECGAPLRRHGGRLRGQVF